MRKYAVQSHYFVERKSVFFVQFFIPLDRNSVIMIFIQVCMFSCFYDIMISRGLWRRNTELHITLTIFNQLLMVNGRIEKDHISFFFYVDDCLLFSQKTINVEAFNLITMDSILFNKHVIQKPRGLMTRSYLIAILLQSEEQNVQTIFFQEKNVNIKKWK